MYFNRDYNFPSKVRMRLDLAGFYSFKTKKAAINLKLYQKRDRRSFSLRYNLNRRHRIGGGSRKGRSEAEETNGCRIENGWNGSSQDIRRHLSFV